MFRSLLAIVAVAIIAGSRPHQLPDRRDLTRFTYRSSRAVFLAGEFNGWNTTATPMQRQSGDDWIVDLPLQPGTYQYKFVVNDDWFQDPSNPESVPDGWGGNNSVITIPATVVSPSPLQTPPALVYGKLSEQNSILQVRWRSIDYPEVPIPGAPDKKLRFRVSSGGEGGPNGEPAHLRFDLIWSGLDNIPAPASLLHPKEISVRLHLGAAGFVTEGQADSSDGWDGFGKGHGMTFSHMFIFPWTRNAFDEAWIECRLPSQTYWIEIPYGFTRNPAEPWPTTDERRAGPLFPAIMDGMPDEDRIVPWLHVDYDLGEIQNRWRLTAEVANPSSAAAEVVLYHAPDTGEGPWSSETPKTSIEIRQTGAHGLGGARAGFYRSELLERKDVFTLGCDSSPAAGRGIGWMTVSVDEKSYTFIIPSSLFRCAHGIADRENKHRIPQGDGLFEGIVRFAR